MSGIDDAKSSEDVYLVPGGCLALEKDEESGDEVQVVYDRVTLREMTGHEEDILSNDNMDINERMYKILGRCIEQLESSETGQVVTDKKRLAESVNNMLMSDNITLLLRLRQVSIGDKVTFRIRCPECKTSQSKVFDLRKIEHVPMKGDKKTRLREYKTKNGNLIQWQMVDGAKQKSIDASQEQKFKRDRATKALMRRVQTINGEPVTLANLKDLPMKERMEIRRQFDDEGGVDTTINVTCTACGVDFITDMEVTGKGFFTPSESSES